ncbi:unnamed protein product [Linum trigynum]|uniref:Uncharacterized protein n=1 Tax=Linum trigynum TaxID=586398 RepID=A0AAV2CUR8_9ROSI
MVEDLSSSQLSRGQLPTKLKLISSTDISELTWVRKQERIWQIVEYWKEHGLRTAAKDGEDGAAGGLPLFAVADGDKEKVSQPDEILMSATNILESTWAQRREQLWQIVDYCKRNSSRRWEDGGNDVTSRHPPAGPKRSHLRDYDQRRSGRQSRGDRGESRGGGAIGVPAGCSFQGDDD